MPAVQAVGIATDRPPPFQLPMLDNRGDVAARLAAIDSMITDDADGWSVAGEMPPPPVPAARTNPDASTNRPPRTPERGSGTRSDAPADVHRAAARVRPAGTSAVSTSPVGTGTIGIGSTGPGGSGIGTGRSDADRTRPDRRASQAAAADAGPDRAVSPPANEAAADGARVRAAATVPAHARMLRPGSGPGLAPAPVSYAADDWRGRIKGAPARADAQVYGAPGGPTSPDPGAESSAAFSVPNTRAGDAMTPAVANKAGGSAAPARHGRASERARAAEAAKPVSILDRAARIGLLGALLAVFVLLFIFGPKISQWWGKL